MKNLNLLCALLLFAVIGTRSIFAAPDAGNQTTHSYSARGVVEKIAPDHQQVTIHHQAIPGYMMEMTMDFPVQNTNELNGISPGDEITFTLVVNQTNDWVENIQRTGHTDKIMNMTSTMNMARNRFTQLKPGDLLPDGELLTENDQRIHLSDFRGKAVAFTFFFTRCPLPNYCPLMNRNFAATRDLILSMTNAPTNWELLSISFDPGFDTPKTLASYAGFYRGENTNHWLFAAATTNTLAEWAPCVGLIVMRQGNNISHNLRTIVLNPKGRIFRQFDGNQWTPQQLAGAILDATHGPMQMTSLPARAPMN
ncbi:MAG TPA: copper-binding protein [Candidatus Aquilonibacter sp.]|nr:copper-binding protein [Candidatus Aquilonibacter sp.]